MSDKPISLGHAKLETTALYTRVAVNTIRDIKSPLERPGVKAALNLLFCKAQLLLRSQEYIGVTLISFHNPAKSIQQFNTFCRRALRTQQTLCSTKGKFIPVGRPFLRPLIPDDYIRPRGEPPAANAERRRPFRRGAHLP